MVINNLDLPGISFVPRKDYPELAIDPDAPQACQFTLKSLQTISGRRLQDLEIAGQVQPIQLSARNRVEVHGQRFPRCVADNALEYVRSCFISK